MDAAEAAWDERPVFGTRRGLPWWGAVLLALLLSAVGAVIDKSRLVDDQRLTGFGIYHALFLAGCVLAVLGVRRRNLFGPMVQPPLIFAATFIPVQFMREPAASGASESGSRKLIFEVALPLASSFPWMAGATVATIALGVIRLFVQRNPDGRAGSLDADEDERPVRRPKDRDRDIDDEPRPARRPARDRDRDDRGERPRPTTKGDRPREQAPPPRRPARDQDRRDRGEAPPRRNPPRPRDQGGGRPRGPQPQQRRRPREDY
ncbi:hypothetical protein SAMN05661093_05308 [Kibdelosporangium aridum]|uniref:DUF6542 domain-containing protein n=2 Tax=Kibdelosporangium aridum TaxID=2030 RepID=A0A1Y5XSZ0_KIBAR|nr:hypothetical protein SAMN05661093_05308 [Kibdelosporangium aridum]